jgi:hypothetical protein
MMKDFTLTTEKRHSWEVFFHANLYALFPGNNTAAFVSENGIHIRTIPGNTCPVRSENSTTGYGIAVDGTP